MKIVVEDLPPGGVAVSAGLETGWALASARQALEGDPQRLRVDVRAEKEGAGARVRGQMEAQVPRRCDRCMEPVLLTLQGPVDLLYVPQDPAAGAGERRLDADELDVGWFAGGALDMGDVLSEQLALWMPERVRCNDPGVIRLAEGSCSAEAGPDAASPGADPAPGRTSPFSGPFANLKLPSSPPSSSSKKK